jgi:Tol biopolymer transport system component
MRTGRRSGLLAILLASSEVGAQDVIRAAPDEWISRHLLGTSMGALYPSISDDGRYVAYQGQHPTVSFARVTYITDRQNPNVPERIGSDCVFGADCDQERPRLSGTGRYVIFDSPQGYGGDPFTGDNAESDQDVFVWDRQTGVTQRVSLGLAGVEPNGESFAGDISRDGRYVVFTSGATNLVSTPSLSGASTLVERSYWKDRETGQVKLVYDPTDTDPRTNDYTGPRLTSNGRYVLAAEQNFTASQSGAGTIAEVINWDGLNSSLGPRLLNANVMGGFNVAMTGDRRFGTQIGGNTQGLTLGLVRLTPPFDLVRSIFWPHVGGLSTTLNGVELSSGAGYLAVNECHVFGPDRVDFHHGLTTRASVRLSNDPQGCSNYRGFDMTSDGRYAVVSTADLGRSPFADDNDGKNDIYLVVNPLWKPSPTNLVALFDAIPANSRNVKVSTDGRIGVFESEIPASEFGAYTDGNGTSDVFRYLADFQQIELISTVDGVNAFPGGARNPAMSANGDAVVFEAPDAGVVVKNLRPDGSLSAPTGSKAASTQSVFLRRLIQNAPQRLSTSRTGSAPNGNSMNPSISPNGRWVGFGTDADNVNPGSDANGVRDVVVIDLDTSQRRCVSTCAGVVADAPSDRPSVSNTGLVAYESASSAVQKAAGLSKASPLAQIVLRDLLANTSQVVSRAGTQPGNGVSSWPSISASGTAIAYQSGASNLDPSGSDGRINVFRYTPSRGNQRLSRRGPPGGKTTLPVDGDSARPAISGDGRFVAWQTTASNLVDNDFNGVTDLIVHDSRASQLARIADGFGGAESNGASETPHLNHNGTAMGFHSFASNLTAESDSDAANANSAPYERDNPLGAHIVFADAFE